MKIEYLWMSLRSVNLIPIRIKFLKAFCDKISFALDDNLQIAARGSLMAFKN